jgi:hypothetical protein
MGFWLPLPAYLYYLYRYFYRFDPSQTPLPLPLARGDRCLYKLSDMPFWGGERVKARILADSIISLTNWFIYYIIPLRFFIYLLSIDKGREKTMGSFLRVAKIEWDEDVDDLPKVTGWLGLDFHVPTIRMNLNWLGEATFTCPGHSRVDSTRQMLQALLDLWEQREFTIKKVED